MPAAQRRVRGLGRRGRRLAGRLLKPQFPVYVCRVWISVISNLNGAGSCWAPEAGVEGRARARGPASLAPSLSLRG